MKKAYGNIWDYYNEYSNNGWIVIPTNGVVKENGNAVMGRGLALQAKETFTLLPSQLGKKIKLYGNHVYPFNEYNIFSFPTKEHYNDKSTLYLIERSTYELKDMTEDYDGIKVYLPQVGCGSGGLYWREVEPILSILDDKFTVILQ